MTLPFGFRYSGVTCGIKASGKRDLAVISTDDTAVAAGVYTTNLVHAASIDWNRSITPSDQFRGIVINSGNANACTGDEGVVANEQMAMLLSAQLDCDPQQIAVLSTGIIGHQLPMEKLQTGIPAAVSAGGSSTEHFTAASEAILTTDQGTKAVTRTVTIDGQEIRIAGMAKGAGMIGPRMATMLAVVTTDAHIEPKIAQELIRAAADHSFNRISVEGHMSTNDALVLIASGKSSAKLDSAESRSAFADGLNDVCLQMAQQIPADGEGASHSIAIEVSGAASDDDADTIARAIAASNLVKTAVTGNDPNWGRIVSAAGYCGVDFDASQVGLKLNGHAVFSAGQPIAFDEASVSQAIADSFETVIELTVGAGSGTASHWTSDLTTAYVEFNSEYTT